MKIAHIIVANMYIEGSGYQENLLTAAHKHNGHAVYIITRKTIFGENAKYQDVSTPTEYEYVNDAGIPVTVLRTHQSILKKFPVIRAFTRRTDGLSRKLRDLEPDVIFLHGLQSIDTLQVIKYVKSHPKVKLFIDQHADYYNTPVNTLSQKFVQKVLYREIAHLAEPYVEKFWGVTPWRVSYLKDVYKLPSKKVDLLIMGGTDQKINWNNRDLIRDNIRQQYDIPRDAFVIVTGGRIDDTKNLGPLIDFVEKKQSNNIYLLVFGKTDEKWGKILDSKKINNIINIGWIESDKVYDYYLASDLGCFPGTHSVLWEQLCACGIPGVFKDWDGGFAHVNVCDNALLLKDVSTENINKELNLIVSNRQLFSVLKSNAEKARPHFLYSNIAKRAINEDL